MRFQPYVGHYRVSRDSKLYHAAKGSSAYSTTLITIILFLVIPAVHHLAWNLIGPFSQLSTVMMTLASKARDDPLQEIDSKFAR